MINNNKIATTLVPLKLRGEIKHFPPANKEWKNSVYLYNKSKLKSLPVKDNLALKLVKSFFNLHMEKSIARSRRMRSLIRKSTAKKLFVSRPEIKQTNDKVTLTVYTFDREKQFLFRKLYFRINKWENFKKVNRLKAPFRRKVKFTRKVQIKKKKPRFKPIQYKQANLLKQKKTGKKIRLVKQKPKNLRGIALKLFKAKYLSQYDQWRHSNELTNKSLASTALSPLSLIDYNSTKEKAVNSLNALLDNPIKRLALNKLKQQWFENFAIKHGYNKLISFKTEKKRLIYYLFKKTKGFRASNIKSLVVRKKNFYPLLVFYKKKPWLEKTSKFKTYRRLLKKRLLMFVKKRAKVIKKKMPLFGFKHSNMASFLKSSYNLSNSRFKDAKRILVYFYIASVLSMLKIKIVSFEDLTRVSARKLKKSSKQDYDILYNPYQDKKLVSSKKKNILIKRKVPFYIRRKQRYSLPLFSKKKISLSLYCKKKKLSIFFNNSSFDNLLSFLLIYLKKIMVKPSSDSHDLKFKLINHFKRFSSKYFLNVFYKSLFFSNKSLDIKFKGFVNNASKRFKAGISKPVKTKDVLEKNLQKFNRDVLTINSFVKLAVNQTKYGKFLLPLKLLISKIYNKKAELNIVNLKSPHLNTDIFTEAVAVKLKKRVGLLKVMRRSLQLVKIPFGFKKASKAFSVNELSTLNLFDNLELVSLRKNLAVRKINGLNYSDSLQMMLKTLYPSLLTLSPLINNVKHRFSLENLKDKIYNKKLNKLSSVFSQIKYKWVTGVRLEAAGRLTRRYTASRSVFKFRQKGNLQNIDYSDKLNLLKDKTSNKLIRNLAKSNSQQSSLTATKRIGAFGLKTLIASY